MNILNVCLVFVTGLAVASAFVPSPVITPNLKDGLCLSRGVCSPRASPISMVSFSKGIVGSNDIATNEVVEAPVEVQSVEVKKSRKERAFEIYEKVSGTFVNLFPVWTTISAGLALCQPSLFSWFTTQYFTAGLAALMLSMGITLSPADFRNVVQNPSAVGLGFVGCYGMMPLLALGLGKVFNLPLDLISGLVLVGSINGGQASNLCAYIARGNVALSVVMTTATTLGAIVMTPLLSKILLGAVVPINAAGIATSTIQVVLLPILVGMLANRFSPKVVRAVLPFSPVVGVLATCLLVASAVAQCAEPIKAAGLALQLPCALLHIIGGLVGYAVPKALGYDETSARTMAIETSMKSSAFGFLLAKLHFAQYAARVPSAVSVVWMALTGSIMAVMWRFIPINSDEHPHIKCDGSSCKVVD